MSDTLPTDDLAATVAALMAPHVAALREQVDALDRGLIAVGQTADVAMARADSLFRCLEMINDATERAGWTHRSEPKVARIQARSKRVRESGLRLVSAEAQPAEAVAAVTRQFSLIRGGAV